MEKQVQFFGQTDSGIFCQALFGSAGAFEKTAGAPPFADWATGDEIRKFISKISKNDRKKYSYVLVNALGAGEWFGSNINADFFPWNALAHKGMDYGHKTFEHFAHAFQHHKNKDPTRAFGLPVLSTLNVPMKRVELIVRLDREKAKEEQADGLIVRIDKGEFPDVSMGCKVPFDVCSICNQKSKTRFDYCQHMAPPAELKGVYGPNKILPDGRKIYVVNTLPKFFDISFVFIGADKTAKVMAKVASKGEQICLGDVCSLDRTQLSADVAEKIAFRGDDLLPGGKADKKPLSSFNKKSLKSGQRVEEEHVKSKHLAREIASDHLEEDPKYYEKLRTIHKEASDSSSDCACGCGTCDPIEKLAEAFDAKPKVAEIVKRIPAGSFMRKVLPNLEASEQNIPNPILDELAENHTLSGILGGAAVLGIILKPVEFQRIVLLKMGDHELADELDRKRRVFRNVPDVNGSVELDPSVYGSGIGQLLRSFIGLRSGFGHPLRLRSMRAMSGLKKSLPTPSSIEDPLLDKVSAAYNGYRQNLLTKLSQVEEVINSDPSLRNELTGLSLLSMIDKTASSTILSNDAVAYLMGAHITDKNLLFNSDAAGAVLEYIA